MLWCWTRFPEVLMTSRGISSRLIIVLCCDKDYKMLIISCVEILSQWLYRCVIICVFVSTFCHICTSLSEWILGRDTYFSMTSCLKQNYWVSRKENRKWTDGTRWRDWWGEKKVDEAGGEEGAGRWCLIHFWDVGSRLGPRLVLAVCLSLDQTWATYGTRA